MQWVVFSLNSHNCLIIMLQLAWSMTFVKVWLSPWDTSCVGEEAQETGPSYRYRCHPVCAACYQAGRQVGLQAATVIILFKMLVSILLPAHLPLWPHTRWHFHAQACTLAPNKSAILQSERTAALLDPAHPLPVTHRWKCNALLSTHILPGTRTRANMLSVMLCPRLAALSICPTSCAHSSTLIRPVLRVTAVCVCVCVHARTYKVLMESACADTFI